MKKRLSISSSDKSITSLKCDAFTLIELLAIIVILAIIAVITVPIILNIIENSRKGAATDSAYGFKDSVQQYYLSKSVNGEFDDVLSNEDTKTVGELETDGLIVSGAKPTDGWVKINKGKVVDYSLKFGDYVVNYDDATASPITTKNGDIETSPAEWFNYSSNGNGTVQIVGLKSEYKAIATNVIIPIKDDNNNVVTEIGFGALTSGSFDSVIIVGEIETIYNGAFSGSIKHKVVIDGKVKTLKNGCFSNNVSLTSVYLGNSIKTIENGAFSYGNSIEKIIIGSGIESIGDMAFAANVINDKKLTVYNRSSLDIEELKDSIFKNRTNVEFK